MRRTIIVTIVVFVGLVDRSIGADVYSFLQEIKVTAGAINGLEWSAAGQLMVYDAGDSSPGYVYFSAGGGNGSAPLLIFGVVGDQIQVDFTDSAGNFNLVYEGNSAGDALVALSSYYNVSVQPQAGGVSSALSGSDSENLAAMAAALSGSGANTVNSMVTGVREMGRSILQVSIWIFGFLIAVPLFAIKPRS